MGNRILVIEDDEDNRQISRHLLVRAGYQMADNATNTAGARFDALTNRLWTHSRPSDPIRFGTGGLLRPLFNVFGK
jgi:hypothetical protein